MMFLQEEQTSEIGVTRIVVISGHANGTISKFWDILVHLFVCMSVCVCRVGRYQKFVSVTLSSCCVWFTTQEEDLLVERGGKF